MRDPAPNGADADNSTLRGVGMAPIDAARAGKIPPPAQPVEYYKSHSLAASNWGALTSSGQPLRRLSSEEAQETVLRGLLATPLAGRRRSPLELVVSITIHVAVVAVVVILPLAFTGVIDSSNLRATYLTMPRPPEAAPPPSAPELPVKHSFRRIPSAALTMPTVIPKKIVQVKDEEAPDINGGGVIGGVAGGQEGGVLGGVLGGTGGGPPPPPPPPPPTRKTVHQVGGDVKPPRQIVKADPVYSPIARTGRVEGVVVIDAVIDERGDVVQARAVSGPGLLIPAALQAVMKWKYEPTYLDGMPVSIEMKVEVSFHLHAPN